MFASRANWFRDFFPMKQVLQKIGGLVNFNYEPGKVADGFGQKVAQNAAQQTYW
jgi:hypothetical protein